MATFNITDTNITDETDISNELPITRLGGSLDPHHDEIGLAFFQVDFNVDVTNDQGESKSFTFTFQTMDRNDGMAAYGGHEMTSYFEHSNDLDDLAAFLGFERIAIDMLEELEYKADEIGKKALEGFIEKYGDQYREKLSADAESELEMLEMESNIDQSMSFN